MIHDSYTYEYMHIWMLPSNHIELTELFQLTVWPMCCKTQTSQMLRTFNSTFKRLAEFLIRLIYLVVMIGFRIRLKYTQTKWVSIASRVGSTIEYPRVWAEIQNRRSTTKQQIRALFREQKKKPPTNNKPSNDFVM